MKAKRRRGNEQKRIVRLREYAYDQQGGLCYWCGNPMSHDVPDGHPSKVTADHINERARFGGAKRYSLEVGNIVAACWKCNQDRGKAFNSAWMLLSQRQRRHHITLAKRKYFFLELTNAQIRGRVHVQYSNNGVGVCIC